MGLWLKKLCTCNKGPFANKVTPPEDGQGLRAAPTLIRRQLDPDLAPPDQEELCALLSHTDQMLPILQSPAPMRQMHSAADSPPDSFWALKRSGQGVNVFLNAELLSMRRLHRSDVGCLIGC